MMKVYKQDLPEITLKYKKGNIKMIQIKSSLDCYTLFKELFDEDTLELYESFICLFLNTANKTIGWIKVSQGGMAGTVVDTRLIMGTALKCAASSIILSHNHPSGHVEPSKQDIELTAKLKEAGKILDIGVLDHIIASNNSYYSFADEGVL